MELESLLESGQRALQEGQFEVAAGIFTDVWLHFGKAWDLAPLAGHALRLSGATVQRRAFWRRVYRESPPSGAHALYELATELLEAGAPEEAVELFRRALAHRPSDPAILSALASALRSAGLLDEAWYAIEVALEREPGNGTFLLTAAQVRHSQGHLEQAIQLLESADEVRPNHRGTRLQRGLTNLLAGRFAPGWADFEYRDQPAIGTSIKEWRGEPLSGTVVVRREQGAGDLFQFLRYVPLLKERGAEQVVIECEGSFVRLLEATGYVVSPKGAVPSADWTVPMLSLPHRLGLERPPEGMEPYLSLPSLGQRPDSSHLRIGVAWQGNPDFGATFLRDFDLQLIEALLQPRDVIWTSLQFGEALPRGPHRESFTLSGDWLDTAQTLATLDGVISVDTSIAHLAGAMGLPVAILLPYSPDWRWGLTGPRTPWYPTATLIRQTAPRDWAGVLPMVHRWIADLQSSSISMTST